jgi:CHAD domain-containing protein
MDRRKEITMPSTNTQEHEAKFEIDSAHLPSLVAQTIPLDGYTLQPIGTQSHTDTYMDTPAYDLLRHGLTLRVRHNGNGYEVGIKSLQAIRNGAIQERLDISIPLTDNSNPFDASTWPKRVDEQLDGTSANLADLRPAVVVRQERQKAHLVSTTPASEPLAEWSLDDVWISSEAVSGESDAHATCQTHFHELEIELLDLDNEPAFAGIVEQVEKQPGLTPVYTSKLVRGLESHVAESHNGQSALTPEMELSEGCRLLLHQQLLVAMMNEHGVRRGKRSAVHDMRVAVRRARAAIRLFGDALGPNTLNPYEKSLKRLARALGHVRDLDVALANMREFRRSQPKNQRKNLKPLCAKLKSRRAHAQTDLVALLDSRKYRKFVADFNRFCTTPEKHEAKSHGNFYAVHPTQVRHTVPSIIMETFEAVRAYEVVFTHPELPPLETFHAIRIQGKYLRYGLEFTQHLMGPAGADLITQLTDLQEYLGKLNDAHVDQERLHGWEKQVKDNTAIDTRLAQISTQIDEQTTAFPPIFARFTGRENRELLANGLAQM